MVMVGGVDGLIKDNGEEENERRTANAADRRQERRLNDGMAWRMDARWRMATASGQRAELRNGGCTEAA
jgi:hypothetical protein